MHLWLWQGRPHSIASSSLLHARTLSLQRQAYHGTIVGSNKGCIEKVQGEGWVPLIAARRD